MVNIVNSTHINFSVHKIHVRKNQNSGGSCLNTFRVNLMFDSILAGLKYKSLQQENREQKRIRENSSNHCKSCVS